MANLTRRSPSGAWTLRLRDGAHGGIDGRHFSVPGRCDLIGASGRWALSGLIQPEFAAVDDFGHSVVVDFGGPNRAVAIRTFDNVGRSLTALELDTPVSWFRVDPRGLLAVAVTPIMYERKDSATVFAVRFSDGGLAWRRPTHTLLSRAISIDRNIRFLGKNGEDFVTFAYGDREGATAEGTARDG